MSGYSSTTIEPWVLPPLPKHELLPYVIDDYSLAMHLGIRCKTLWYLVIRRTKQYKTFTIRKSNGTLRQLHAPSDRMKFVQKMICKRILSKIPVMECVGAYVPGVSCLNNAEKHIGKGVRIGIDLRDFFPTHSRRRVMKFFSENFGYSDQVSLLLATLCTVVDDAVSRRKSDGKEYHKNFVPQGSPASPMLCNLIAQETLDKAILALVGPYGWTYTRYSDDLTFSHPDDIPRTEVKALIKQIYRTINDSGYLVNYKKTRIQFRWRRQRMLGMTVNEKPNIPRDLYRKYRAIIHNCLKEGFDAQAEKFGYDGLDFKAHLKGILNYFKRINEDKTKKLIQEFELAVKRETHAHPHTHTSANYS